MKERKLKKCQVLTIFLLAVDTPCSTQALIPLSTWLFAYGGVQLFLVLIGVLALVMFIFEHIAAFILWIILMVVGGLFMFAWNIVGAVSLFRDANTCMDQAYPLWAMTLAVLIVQWIGMCVSCFSSKASNDSA